MRCLRVKCGSEGQYTSFDKADGQHLSDFDATSHV